MAGRLGCRLGACRWAAVVVGLAPSDFARSLDVDPHNRPQPRTPASPPRHALPAGSRQPDLLSAVLLISRHARPHLDEADVYRQLDALTAAAARLLPDSEGERYPLRIVKAIITALQEAGFKGAGPEVGCLGLGWRRGRRGRPMQGAGRSRGRAAGRIARDPRHPRPPACLAATSGPQGAVWAA